VYGRASKKLVDGRKAIGTACDTDLTGYSQKVRGIWATVLDPEPAVRRPSDRKLRDRDGVRLLGDKTPWDLTPVEFTVMCRRYGGQSAQEIAADLYTDGETETAIQRVKDLVIRCRNQILESDSSLAILAGFSIRVFALWKAMKESSNLMKLPSPEHIEHWQGLLEPKDPSMLKDVAGDLGLTFEEEGGSEEKAAAAEQNLGVVTTGTERPPAPRKPGQQLRTRSPMPRVCPRCEKGKMILERDWYGQYSTCLCCGYVHEVTAPPTEYEEEDENKQRQRRRQPSHGKIRL